MKTKTIYKVMGIGEGDGARDNPVKLERERWKVRKKESD
jgi:hypothetical protein